MENSQAAGPEERSYVMIHFTCDKDKLMGAISVALSLIHICHLRWSIFPEREGRSDFYPTREVLI